MGGLPLQDYWNRAFLTGQEYSPSVHPVAIMGILNVTPDSFSDGGHYHRFDPAVHRARVMIDEGASIIDVGGESTRPGSNPVSAEEQIKRTIPIIQHIRDHHTALISIDTTSAKVAEAALNAGAHLINDTSGLLDDDCMESLILERGCPIILMHRGGTPRTMQDNPHYTDVVAEIRSFLLRQRKRLLDRGFSPAKVILDPGFGFGKTVNDNLVLLANLDLFTDLGSPVLSGFSRKSTIGAVLVSSVEERLEGSLATAVLAVSAGAAIVRVHDVKETHRAITMTCATLSRHRSRMTSVALSESA